jgi:hypothetical protein
MNLPAVQPQVVSPTALLTGEERLAYAKDLSESTIISSFFRGSVPNMLYAMELGKIYDLEPAAILQNIHVFETWKDGKCTLKAGLSANLMVSLARKAGHIVTTTANPVKATTKIIRGDTILARMIRGDVDREELEHYTRILEALQKMGMKPDEIGVAEATWNETKATTAGLFGKGNWAKYPHAMLAARAKTDAVRLACEEVLIQLSNNAARIGQFATADGQPIDVRWGHTADELDAEITDDGELVSTSSSPRPQRPSVTAQAPAPEPRPAPAPAVDQQQSAQADIAAQASSDPSKAGWGKAAAETAPKTDGQAAKVRAFVEAKPFEETLKLLDRTATADGMSDDDRRSRLVMLLNPVAELCTTDQIMQVLAEVPGCVDEALLAIADYAQAAKVAEVIQEIALAEDTEAKVRLGQVHTIYNRLKEHDRLDDPAPFFDKANDQARDTKLGSAVKILVQDLIKSA